MRLHLWGLNALWRSGSNVPPNSSRDPKVGSKMEQRKNKKTRACSLTCNTSRVGRRARAPGWD